MGEVDRAEDLTLDQQVALKFLPERAGDAPESLARFHNELRVARQVSHKNICRLYDLGETDGRRFLTMEYVDGEDLASLLRRIVRFPQDTAIESALFVVVVGLVIDHMLTAVPIAGRLSTWAAGTGRPEGLHYTCVLHPATYVVPTFKFAAASRGVSASRSTDLRATDVSDSVRAIPFSPPDTCDPRNCADRA
jgi:hypothetical protein